MKKLFTLFLALAIGFGLKAQCPLTQAVDFTATDCHGTEVHLFDILDRGQYVLIDFFFANCGPCQQATPKVVESYYAFGCNQYDVFYMEISDRDSDAVCQNWCQNYGVEYPTISGPAGGSTICGTSMYNIPAFPTVILIAPDRSIVIQDLWPINNAQTIITALEQHGIQQHECGEVPACNAPTDLVASFETLIIELNDTPTINLNWTASETAQSYNIYRDGELIANVAETSYSDNDSIYGLNEYCYMVTSVCEDNLESDASDEFCIVPEYVEISLDTIYYEDGWIGKSRGDWGDIDVFNFTTQDLIFGEFTSEEFGEYIHLYDWSYETEFTQGFTLASGEFESLFLSFYSYSAKDQIYTGYMRVSTSVGDFEWFIVYTWIENVDETQQPSLITLFPNPANESMTLSGEISGMVKVFNALGQQIDEYETNGTKLNISTSHYENGFYFVKVNDKTIKFIVKH